MREGRKDNEGRKEGRKMRTSPMVDMRCLFLLAPLRKTMEKLMPEGRKERNGRKGGRKE